MPPPLQCGPGRWRLGWCPCPRLGAELARAGRKPAGSSEEPRVPGAEDWDFVGQLNRHPHLARKDPALSSRASRCSGCGRAPDGLPRAGSGRPLSNARCSADALGFPQAASPKEGSRPARPQPAGSETSPGRITRCSKLSVWWLPGHPRPPQRSPGTGVGAVREPSLPQPPAKHQSYSRNFATIPRRALEAQLRATSVTCAQIRRAQGPAERPPNAGRATAGVGGSHCEPGPAPRRSPRLARCEPEPRWTCPGPRGRRRPCPKKDKPGTAGTGARCRDPSKVGGVPLARTAQAGSTCW